MEFAYYNPSDESRSCVTRTMTKVTGKPYQTVRDELAALAAEAGQPDWNDPTIFERYMAQHGIYPFMEECGMQVQDLPALSGVCCVLCTNRAGFFHLFPVIDNGIYDRRDESRALYAVTVYKQRNNT